MWIDSYLVICKTQGIVEVTK